MLCMTRNGTATSAAPPPRSKTRTSTSSHHLQAGRHPGTPHRARPLPHSLQTGRPFPHRQARHNRQSSRPRELCHPTFRCRPTHPHNRPLCPSPRPQPCLAQAPPHNCQRHATLKQAPHILQQTLPHTWLILPARWVCHPTHTPPSCIHQAPGPLQRRHAGPGRRIQRSPPWAHTRTPPTDRLYHRP